MSKNKNKFYMNNKNNNIKCSFDDNFSEEINKEIFN